MVAATNIDLGSPNGDEDGFTISESLVPAREIKVAGITHVGLDGVLKNPLILKEDLRNGCGGQLWPAGIALAKYMLQKHASDLPGKSMSVSLQSPWCNVFTVSNLPRLLVESSSARVEV